MQRQLLLYFIESNKGMSAKQEVASVKKAVRNYRLTFNTEVPLILI